ncbi:TPA: hypothetical protein ACG5NK_002903, partial [Enterococcus faecium]
MEKRYFYDIHDISFFVECERIKNQNDTRLNEYDHIIIKKVEFLCKKQINLIDKINSKNFKQTMQNLIEIDSKIASYLFFLIHDEFL